MAKNRDQQSFFDRAMSFADRFFNGVDKLKKAGDEARKENVELLDQMNPGFKESYERSMKNAAELGSKLEAKTEKLLFGKEMYWGAGGEARKEEEKRRSLNEQIQSASSRTTEPQAKDKAPAKESSPER